MNNGIGGMGGTGYGTLGQLDHLSDRHIGGIIGTGTGAPSLQ
jgi:hypothetical protein